MSKKCNKCGAILEDNAEFCGYCGSEVKEENKNNNNKNRIPLITSIVAVIAIAVSIIFFSSGIKLDDYIEYNITGTNGQAVCSVHIDEIGLVEDIMQDGKIKEEQYFSLLWDGIGSDFDISVNPQKDLKNGDKVHITVKASKNKHNLKFKEYKKTVKVKDLREAEVIDLEDTSSIVITGVSPYLTVDSASNSYCQGGLKASKTENIANGDVITFTAENSPIEGYVYNVDSFEVKVENYPEYVTSSDELSAEEKQKIKNDAIELIADVSGYLPSYGPDIYLDSLDDALFPRKERAPESVDKESIKFDEVHVYAKQEDDIVITNIPYECDCFIGKDVVKYHVYGVITFDNVKHNENGELEYKIHKRTNLYVDHGDLESKIESEYYSIPANNYNEYKYSL